MNRNHQNRNALNHTARGRMHVARRQLGPGFHTPMKTNPSEERSVRYSTAPIWSEKDYPFIDQDRFFYYSPESSQSDNYVVSDVEPIRINAKESMRHQNDFTHPHDYHGREFSYRAQIESGANAPMKSYAGYGPKHYTRSDERIEEELCERLKKDIYIDASDIDLTVSNGVVRIFGTVPARYHKFEIEDMAEKIPGVVEIDNDIRVKKH